MQRQQHDIREQAPWNDEAVYERDVDKDAMQEIVHRARLTTLSPGYPHATEDGTKPCLAKPVKDFVKDYKGNRNLTYRSQRFSSEVVLTKDRIADARARDIRRRWSQSRSCYWMVSKDDSDDAQSQQDNDRETRSRRQS